MLVILKLLYLSPSFQKYKFFGFGWESLGYWPEFIDTALNNAVFDVCGKYHSLDIIYPIFNKLISLFLRSINIIIVIFFILNYFIIVLF
jgi:hypothetical protein